jgi:glucokinase
MYSPNIKAQNMAVSDLALGIDLGGTNLRIGLVDQCGSLVDFTARPIDGKLPGDAILEEILSLSKSLPEYSRAACVGLALAGAVLPHGVIEKELTNLEGLHHYPLKDRLEKAFGKPCWLENDAVLALLGEYRFGAGRGCQDALLLTLGTGIGGALLLNGSVRKGPHGLGCEVGMLPFPNPDIRCLTPFEKLASPKSIMDSLGDPSGFLYERALTGDVQAQEALDRMYRHLGWMVTAMHLAVDLDLVILSGGLASVGEPLRVGVFKAYQEICPTEIQFNLEIVTGTLPQHAAGVIGAACMCFEQRLHLG